MDENNNEELDQMQEDRQMKLAEKSGKEALKKQAKKDAIKKVMKTVLKAIVAKIQFIFVIAVITSLVAMILVSLISSIFGGDTESEISFSKKMNSETVGLTLGEYLVQFSHSGEAPQSDDGKFYKMYSDDPSAGWPTIGNSDLQWVSHQAKFACKGKVLKTNGEYTESNVQDYVNGLLTRGASAKYSQSEIDSMGIYIEKALVDSVGQTVAETYYQTVQNITKDLNLSQQQLYALTTIQYNFGYLPTRNGYTFKSVYEEGAGLYAINSWEHMKYIWDNWWCHVGGGQPGHIPMRDAAFETFVKGVYDFTYSEAGEVFGRSYYIYYTQEQLDEFDYAPDKPLYRTEDNEEEIFTYQEITSSHFDGETIDAAGYTFPHYLQKDYSGAYGSSTIKAAGCGPTSMAMILAGLCRDSSITPATFVDNLDRFYNGNWRKYYLPGAGSIWGGICNNDFLQEYYNCKATYVSNAQQAWDALAAGKCVIAAETGHILALIPLPNEYKAGGYLFYVLDSARGHSGAFKSISDFTSSTTAEKLVLRYIIEPIN